MQKVHYRGSLAQKLRIRRDIEEVFRNAIALDHAANPFIRVDRNRALLDDHLIGVDGAGNLAGDRVHVGKIGASRAALRRSHGNKDGLRGLCCGTQVRGELHQVSAVTVQQLRQILLVDRNPALLQRSHLGLIVVHTDDAVPNLRKACGGNKSNVSGTNNGDRNWLSHRILL